MEKPSKLALEFLETIKINADKEINKHLKAGRCVFGLRNNKLIKLCLK